jgi:hypothetical protein
MILVGSRALYIRNKEILGRKPKDFDFICRENEFDEWNEKNYKKVGGKSITKEDNKIIVSGDVMCEFDLILPNSSNEMLESIVEKDRKTLATPFGSVPSVNLLFAIKKSHRYKGGPHFWKTAIDYHTLQDAGCAVQPEHEEFFKLRQKESYQKTPSLNMTKKDFFDSDKNGVKQVFDHDDIHRAVALYDKPAYFYYLKDGEEVLTDKSKFFQCEEKIRLAGVIEETTVLAIERSMIPFPDSNPKHSWMFSLAKVCSTITGGYFREYAYENIFKIAEMYPENYWKNFQEAVANGKVKKIKET